MATQNSKVTEVKAFARGIHISPKKVRLVSNLVKDLPVSDAMIQLDFLTKKSARPLKKLVVQAIANAKHNYQIEENLLYIKTLRIDGGPVFFRYQPRARGRASPIRKRTSHISLVLGVNLKPFPSRGFKPKPKVPEPAPGAENRLQSPKEGQYDVSSPHKKEVKKPWYSFLRRQNAPKTDQKPASSWEQAKSQPQPKPYPTFDRRGKM